MLEGTAKWKKIVGLVILAFSWLVMLYNMAELLVANRPSTIEMLHRRPPASTIVEAGYWSWFRTALWGILTTPFMWIAHGFTAVPNWFRYHIGASRA
jgi:hypothetical protein